KPRLDRERERCTCPPALSLLDHLAGRRARITPHACSPSPAGDIRRRIGPSGVPYHALVSPNQSVLQSGEQHPASAVGRPGGNRTGGALPAYQEDPCAAIPLRCHPLRPGRRADRTDRCVAAARVGEDRRRRGVVATLAGLTAPPSSMWWRRSTVRPGA